MVVAKTKEEDTTVEEAGSQSMYSGLGLSHRAREVQLTKSFIDKPKGSNSTTQELLIMNRRTKKNILSYVRSNKNVFEVEQSQKNLVTY